MTGDSYYDILGVQSDASLQEIKTKYRSLIRRIHPDMDGPVALFRQVQEAYSVLSDPSRRAEYDIRLSARGSGTRATAKDPASGSAKVSREAPKGSDRGRASVPRNGSSPRTDALRFRSFPSENPAGATALGGSLLVVFGAALGGDAGWVLVGLGCLGFVLGLLAGLGHYGTRRLTAYGRSGMAAIDAMSNGEFEAFIGGLFVRKGYRIARLGGRREGRTGLLLHRAGGTTVVQVKRRTAMINQDAVQDAAVAKDRFRASNALVVTSSTYSPNAISFAGSCGVSLWNRATLAAELDALQRDQRSTGPRRLVSDLRAGALVCLSAWVSTLVLFSMMSTRIFRTRRQKGSGGRT